MINIKTNIKTSVNFDQIKSDQRLLFAKALTFSAEKVQEKMIPYTGERFVIRKTWLQRGKYSIRKTTASADNLVATVWNDAPWLVGQEEGEVRTPIKKYLAVPTEELLTELGSPVSKGKHIYSSKIIPKSLRPKALLKHDAFTKRRSRKKTRNKTITSNTRFWIEERNGTPFLFRAIGTKLTPLWLFIPVSNIKPQWEFVNKGIELFEKEFPPIFLRLMEKFYNRLNQ